jgi:hypothetical protein
MDQNTHTSKTIALIAAGLVVVGALLMFLFNNGAEAPAVAEVPVVPPAGEPPVPPQQPAVVPEGEVMNPAVVPVGAPSSMNDMDQMYADGTYTTTGDYKAPSGPESITVKLTLENGVVTKSEVTGTSKNDVTQKFITGFSQNHTAFVVGKKIDEVNLTVVSGSSLTPFGFNAAVEAIKKEASKS